MLTTTWVQPAAAHGEHAAGQAPPHGAAAEELDPTEEDEPLADDDAAAVDVPPVEDAVVDDAVVEDAAADEAFPDADEEGVTWEEPDDELPPPAALEDGDPSEELRPEELTRKVEDMRDAPEEDATTEPDEEPEAAA